MVRTTGNLKISIMLVLSISILAAVLVTGTVVKIVSAANSINVQTKTHQHPVTSTGNPHIVSSAVHGINIQNMTREHRSVSPNIIPAAAHGIRLQPKTNQHVLTGTGSPHIVSAVAHGSIKVKTTTNIREYPVRSAVPYGYCFFYRGQGHILYAMHFRYQKYAPSQVS